MNGIAGKLAFVTGAGGGIGAAVVRALAAEGARVIATDRDQTTLEKLCDMSGAIKTHRLDISDSEAVAALIAQVETEDGGIDLGVNVAGILTTGLVVETSEAAWKETFDVNVNGLFHVSRALAKAMMARRAGVIVTVSSNAAGVPRHAMAAYAASKAAATMFTRCLGLELAPYNIRCNIVAPGSTLTPMQTDMWADDKGAERVIEGSLETYKPGIPLRKLATPEDVANAVMFLLSDQASHITMTDLYVDGGATLRG